MLIQLIEFTTTLLQWTESEELKISAEQIYTVLLFMTMTKEQEELLLIDPNQFVSDEDNEFTSKDLKGWWIDFVFEIIDQHSQLPLVLNAVEKLLVNDTDSDSLLRNSTLQLNLKQKEVGLYWLGQLACVIKDEAESTNFNIINVVKTLVYPILKDPHNQPLYLQLRALWVLNKLSSLIVETSQQNYLFKIAQDYFINSEHLAIKLTSCSVLSSYKQWISSWEAEGLQSAILNLLEAANVDTVSIPLDLLRDYSTQKEDTSSLLTSEIIQGILTLFKRFHFDSWVGDDFVQLLSTWIDKDFMKMAKFILPFGIEIIQINHRANKNNSSEATEELAGSSLFTYSVEIINKCLDMAVQRGQVPEIINLDFIKFLAGILIESKDVLLLIHLLKCFENSISVLHSLVVSSREAVELIKQVIEKFLNPEKTYETCILHIGNLVVLYLSKLSPNMVEDFKAMTPYFISRLTKCSSPNILESLLYPFFYTVVQNTESMLEHTSDKHLQIFVDKWVDYVEYGNFKNQQAKSACLECLLSTIIGKLNSGGGSSHPNSNICSRLPQVREYTSIFAFILLLWKIVQRSRISYEFEWYDVDFEESVKTESDVESKWVEVLRAHIQQNQEISQQLQSCLEGQVNPQDVELIKSCLF